MNRLLSDDAKSQIYSDTYGIDAAITAITRAQLAKTDKEWVEWVVTNAEVEGEDIILPGKLWRERRKEIGI